MDIVASTDKWYVMPTGVMMQSVCVNNPDVDIVFHVVIDDNVTKKDQQDLKNVVASFSGKSLVFYNISEYIKNYRFPSLDYGLTRAAYFRLWLAEFLPKTINKILYLDVDIIVRHSLLPLWNTNLDGYAVAAVPVDNWKVTVEYYSRLNESPLLGYFNSGVLLINLKYWRDFVVLKDFEEYMQTHFDEIRYCDQDVLNYVFMKKKIDLPFKYNMQCGFVQKHSPYDIRYEEEVLESRKDPVIIHYNGDNPWNAYMRNYHPYRSSFYKYQDQTKWKGKRVETRPFKLRMINFAADLLRKWGLKRQLVSDIYLDIDPID